MKRFLSLLVVCASASSAFAQAPGQEPPLPHSKNLLDAMIAAGPVMALLALLSIFSVMLIVVFFLTIRRGAVVGGG